MKSWEEKTGSSKILRSDWENLLWIQQFQPFLLNFFCVKNIRKCFFFVFFRQLGNGFWNPDLFAHIDQSVQSVFWRWIAQHEPVIFVDERRLSECALRVLEARPRTPRPLRMLCCTGSSRTGAPAGALEGAREGAAAAPTVGRVALQAACHYPPALHRALTPSLSPALISMCRGFVPDRERKAESCCLCLSWRGVTAHGRLPRHCLCSIGTQWGGGAEAWLNAGKCVLTWLRAEWRRRNGTQPFSACWEGSTSASTQVCVCVFEI